MRTLTAIIDKLKQDVSSLEFIPTGFKEVDDFLDGGFMKKELIVIGAFTGSGKSYFAGQILWNIATQGFKTGYFSLEISDSTIASRLLGMLSDIKPTRIMKGLLTEDEFRRKQEAEARLMTYEPLIDIWDDQYDLRNIANFIRKNKYDFIVIDFLQNVMLGKENEYERLSYVSLFLQKLAKETDCCILALSQLSNSAAKTGDMEYKGSGSIAMVCDLGFFLRRSDVEVNTNQIQLSLKKNRRGFSGKDFILTFKQPGGKIE